MTTGAAKAPARAPMLEGPLQVRGVSVEAGGASILSGVTYDLLPGELCALLGPSGSGKSTLLKVLLGLRAPSQGSVKLAGRDVRSVGPLGYVPQEDALHLSLRVRDALDYAARLRMPDLDADGRAARVDEVLRQVGLDQRADLRIKRLSGGQKKRVSVALELLTSPGLLILDEPTSGLDPGLEAQMTALFASLAREGRVVLVATHAMESLDRCDALLLIVEGYVAFFGAPKDALAYFGVDRYARIFDVLKRHDGATWAKRHLASPERARFLQRRVEPRGRVDAAQARGPA